MAETDFGFFGAASANVRRGVTTAFTRPPGGGNFVFGFNAVVATAGSLGLYYNANNFAPLRDDALSATGGSVSAALKRAISNTPAGFSVGLFICLQGATDGDYGYILGLGDSDPSPIILAKTTLSSGLSPSSAAVLRASSTTHLWDTWLHLRLDAIVNPNGDVILKCFQNDLTGETSSVALPDWQAINGMDDYVDDALGISTGSAPLAGGYIGFGFNSTATNTRALVDYFQASRQK